jgi:hypothetical protein
MTGLPSTSSFSTSLELRLRQALELGSVSCEHQHHMRYETRSLNTQGVWGSLTTGGSLTIQGPSPPRVTYYTGSSITWNPHHSTISHHQRVSYNTRDPHVSVISTTVVKPGSTLIRVDFPQKPASTVTEQLDITNKETTYVANASCLLNVFPVRFFHIILPWSKHCKLNNNLINCRIHQVILWSSPYFCHMQP